MEIRSQSKYRHLQDVLCIASVVLFIVITRFIGGGLNRPLEQDELVSLKYYTSVPYDFHSRYDAGHAQGSIGLLARGWVKCFLNPWNPNSHVLNSLLSSLSAFLFGFHEWAFRLPALVALMLIAAALFLYSRSRLGTLPALVLVLALTAHPYFVFYSMSCRGYTITALLTLCSIWFTGKFLSKSSLWAGGGMALCHVLMFLNLGSILFVWITPVTLVVLATTLRRGPRTITIYENLAMLAPAIWVAVGTFLSIGMYIVGALHYFFNAQAQYGLPFKGGAEFLQGLHSVGNELCPNPVWALVFLFGAAGYVPMLRTERRWLAHTVLLSVIIAFAYTLATHKFLYPRTFGYIIMLAAIGCIELWGAIGCNVLASRIIRPTMTILMLWALIDSAGGTLHFGLTREPTYSDLALAIDNYCPEPDVLIELPWVYGEEMAAYLPADPKRYDLVPGQVGKAVAVYFPCVYYRDKAWFRTQTRQREVQEMDYWQLPPHWQLVRAFKTLAVCRVNTLVHRSFSDIPADTSEAIIVWNKMDPYFSLANYVRDHIAVRRHPWIVEATTMTPELLQLFASSPQEIAAAREIVADLGSRTKGDVYVLVPQK